MQRLKGLLTQLLSNRSSYKELPARPGPQHDLTLCLGGVPDEAEGSIRFSGTSTAYSHCHSALLLVEVCSYQGCKVVCRLATMHHETCVGCRRLESPSRPLTPCFSGCCFPLSSVHLQVGQSTEWYLFLSLFFDKWHVQLSKELECSLRDTSTLRISNE